MSQEEAIASINVQLCPKSSNERLCIRNCVQKAWCKYDTDYDTYISREEFLNEDMIKFIIKLEQAWKKKCIEKESKTVMKKQLWVPIVRPLLSGSLPELSMRPREWYEQVDTEKQ